MRLAVVLGRSCRLRPLDQPPRPTQAALRRRLRDPPTRLPAQRCLMRHKRHRRVEQPSPQQVWRTGRTRASTGRPRVCDSAYAASRGLPNARSGPTGSYRSSDVEVQAVFAGRSSRPSTSAGGGRRVACRRTRRTASGSSDGSAAAVSAGEGWGVGVGAMALLTSPPTDEKVATPGTDDALSKPQSLPRVDLHRLRGTRPIPRRG
jgi:hypothetical protein